MGFKTVYEHSYEKESLVIFSYIYFVYSSLSKRLYSISIIKQLFDNAGEKWIKKLLKQLNGGVWKHSSLRVRLDLIFINSFLKVCRLTKIYGFLFFLQATFYMFSSIGVNLYRIWFFENRKKIIFFVLPRSCFFPES
jgi:hypothetical protein